MYFSHWFLRLLAWIYFWRILSCERHRICWWSVHYREVIMSAMASQIISISTVRSAFFCGESNGYRWKSRTEGKKRGKWSHLVASCLLRFMSWPGTIIQQADAMANVDPYLHRHMVSIGVNTMHLTERITLFIFCIGEVENNITKSAW